MRLLAQLRRVLRDLIAELIVLDLPVEGVDGNEERQQARTLDVPQELQAEPLPLVRPFDDAGDVRHDEGAAVAQLHYAEIRRERRKGVVADLRRGSADDGEQRGLAGVRLAHEPDVRDELELELERDGLSLFSGLPLARTAVHRRGEPGIALASAAAVRDDETVVVGEHLGDHLAGVVIAHHGSRWHGKHDVVARAAGLVRAAAMVATLRLPGVAVGVVQQRGQIVVGANDHIPSLAAVTAVGTAHGRELLAAEGDDPRAAVSRGDSNDDAVDEHPDDPAKVGERVVAASANTRGRN